MGYAAYTSCPASEVPPGAVWHAAERRWADTGRLRAEYSWGPPDSHPEWKWEGFAGMPWMRTTDTTLPEDDPRRVTYFRISGAG
jgi:hypothetical protein